MRIFSRRLVVSVASAFLVVPAAVAAGASGHVLSNAELLRSSDNVTGSGFGTSSASFSLSSGSTGVLDWNSFNVQSGETLKFGNGTWYNAVSGSGSSEIAGSILGSGANVYLFNPNGVIFSSGSLIDVGSFTAAGFEMTNLDDMIDDPTLTPAFSTKMLGDIDVSGGTFRSDRVNLLGRNVSVRDATFTGDVSIGAGQKVTVDSIGGGSISFSVSGSSGNASFVNSSARKLDIRAAGNVYLGKSGDLALENVSAGKSVTAVADGAVSVGGRVAAKQDVVVSAGKDVSWTSDGLLRAGRNVRVESTGGNVALGAVSAKKTSVEASGNVTGRLGAEDRLLNGNEKACATYRIEADGTVVVSFEKATIDVSGRKGVALNSSDSLTISSVDVATVRLEPGVDESGNRTLVETKVRDEALGGYLSPETDVTLSVPGNLTVNGTIKTIEGRGLSDPESIRLVSEDADVSVGGRVSAQDSFSIDSGRDIRIDGAVSSDGALALTAGGSVALGKNPNSLKSDDLSITVGASGDSSRYEGEGRDGVLLLTQSKKGSTGKLTSSGAILVIDGSIAGGAAVNVAAMQELEAVASEGNSALPIRDPQAELSASPFAPADVSAQLPVAATEVNQDESALMKAAQEEEKWTLKNVQE